MRKYLLIAILAGMSFSAKAQECFLGKSQRIIMDSLKKTNYRRFEGQITTDGYIMNFQYDEMQDSSYLKKLETSKILSVTDSINYSFVFRDDYCFSDAIYHINPNDLQKVIIELNSHYINKFKDTVWVNQSGTIKVKIEKQKYSNVFYVKFNKIENK